ncbi:MAG TPA: PilN domain-containing protein [Dongiaceae bacterium]|jgi:Tfp pilus assembly protein PilN|nr:PilN domain-containing protein [Dongiaceae bacterium]
MTARMVNLIPAHRRVAQQRGRRLKVWIGVTIGWAGLLLAICAGVRYGGASDADAAAANELRGVQSRIEQLDQMLATVKKQLAEAQSRQQTVIAITDQPDWSILLSLLARVREDVVLREVTLRPDPATRNITLALRGFSRTQAEASQFVLRLQQIGLFDEVKLLRTGREPVMNTAAVSFDVSCEIRGADSAGKARQP